MSPEVTAAIIAASVSFLTLIGTLAAQYFGRRATSKQLDKTLAEQRTRTLNERFATAAEQLGSDKPAVRLAGVYAMAGLADDWEENRQTCVDVLCAYLRSHTSLILARKLLRRDDLRSRPAARSATPSSGSSPRTSKMTRRCPGRA